MNKNTITSIAIILVMVLLVGGLIYYSNNSGQNQKSPDSTGSSLTDLGQLPTRESSESSNSPKPTQASKGNNSMNNKYSEAPKLSIDQKKDYKAIIHTSKGDIKVDLYETKVPNTVNNFVFLAREAFYNNTIFHRVIKDFMIQGGDPTGTGMGGPGYRFADEKFDGEYVRGTLAMANAGPNTNGSQFFIMHKDNPLPKNYVIFGNVLDDEGLKVLDAIAGAQVTRSSTGEASKPVDPVTVTSVEIID